MPRVNWDRIRSERDKIIGENYDVVHGIAIFGAGYLGGIVRDHLLKLDIPLKYFVDNDATIQGTSRDGISIISPAMLHDDPPSLILIAARHGSNQIKAQLASQGFSSVSAESYLAATDIPNFERVQGLFEDDRSHEILDSILMGRLTEDNQYYRDIFETQQYFALPQFAFPYQDIFVDAGAFVGDTVERLIWASDGYIGKIYAFEPCTAQADALELRINRLIREWALRPDQFTIIRAGLGATDCTAGFDSRPETPTAGTFKAYHLGTPVRVHSLDSFLDGKPVTFIKVDVEGMEPELLSGAAETIRIHRPRLALSIYHDPRHLHEIPLYVKSLVPEYKMALRHHSPRGVETILYCWID